jgi:hypothetical protein
LLLRDRGIDVKAVDERIRGQRKGLRFGCSICVEDLRIESRRARDVRSGATNPVRSQ